MNRKRDINALTCIIRQLEYDALDPCTFTCAPNYNRNEIEATAASVKAKSTNTSTCSIKDNEG